MAKNRIINILSLLLIIRGCGLAHFYFFQSHGFQALEAFWSYIAYSHFCSGHMNKESLLVYVETYSGYLCNSVIKCCLVELPDASPNCLNVF